MLNRGSPLGLIAGPCVIESEEHVHFLAGAIRKIAGDFIFKASFDKANRSSVTSYRGPGMKEGLRILAGLKAEGFRVLTDIHTPEQAAAAAEVVDVLQIPAFLCRQTDLLVEAGRTGRVVNIKKGQFVAPQDLRLAAEKVASTGNQNIWLTERGSCFGYNNLVVDMRGLAMMREFGWPGDFRRHAQCAVAGQRWDGIGRTAAIHRTAGKGCGGGGSGGDIRGGARGARAGLVGREQRAATGSVGWAAGEAAGYRLGGEAGLNYMLYAER